MQDVSNLPVSAELLNYYRQRLEKADKDYEDALNRIEGLRISQEEHHRAQWELQKREQEIEELQRTLSDHRAHAFEERKQLLKVIGENDNLKVQELKDRKKIRYLLSVSGNSPNEITYFRDKLDKRLIRIHQSAQARKNSKEKEERDIIILEDEIEGLRLNVIALQTQLDEQRTFYEQTFSQLKRDRENSIQEHKSWMEQQHQKNAELIEANHRLRSLCRENTRELLHAKRAIHNHERQLVEGKTKLLDENAELKKSYQEEKTRSQTIEKTLETKMTKKYDTVAAELRSKNSKLEEDLKVTKMRLEDLSTQYQRKVDHLKARSDSAVASYTALKKRRDFEIEGFTNDIIQLRKQLKTLERNILKYAPLEDKELVLLGMAQATGKRVSQLSSTLQGLKAKVYSVEADMRRSVAA